jgi:hypothetical protein
MPSVKTVIAPGIEKQEVRHMTLRSLRLALPFAVLLLAGSPPVTAAGVVKCKGADGTVTYTQNACPAGTKPMDIPPAYAPEAATPNTAKGRLSTQGMYFQTQIERCLASSGDEACRMLDATAEICRNKAEWRNPNCLAFKEAAEATRDQIEMTDDRSMRALRAGCSVGHEPACVEVACPPNVFQRGQEVDVRACAHRRKFPSSSKWVQLSEQRSKDFSSYSFLCMQRLDGVNSFGVERQYRPTISVVGKTMPGDISTTYRAGNLPDESFSTAGEAAVAGCKAQIEKADEQKKSRAKPLQGV